jgi:CrcB protein
MVGLQYYLWIALGGALGAMSRYGVGRWVQTRLPMSTFPWGTFLINVSGSLLLGFIATLVAEKYLHRLNWQPFIMIGFIGAYTTFSTYEYESLQLGSSWQAFWNLLGSVVAGYAAVWIGARLAYIVMAAIQHAPRQ